MIAPAAMMVETAKDRLYDADYTLKHHVMLRAQLKEVACATPNQTADYYAGYQLGMETARVLLDSMPHAVFNKVSI